MSGNEIQVGDVVTYARSKWIVQEITKGLALIEDSWDMKAVPVTSLKKAKS